MIAKETAVCNEALDLLGAKSITDFKTDTSVAADKCRTHYERVKKSLFRSFLWPFAKTRIALAGDWITATAYTADQYVWEASVLYKCILAHTSGTFAADLAVPKWEIYAARPSHEWAYQYAMPADLLRLEKVYGFDTGDYVYENGMILTDEAELQISYIRDIPDPDDWDELFRQVFAYQLANRLVYSLLGTGLDAVETKKLVVTELQALLSKTRVILGQEGVVTGKNDWNDERYT